MEFTRLAERVPYGQKSRDANAFEDQEALSLSSWEVASIEMHVNKERLKMIKEMRCNRRRHGNYIKHF